MITHVFDSTAVLAHYFNDPGAEVADRILQDHRSHVGICALSVASLRATLQRVISDPPELERVLQLYTEEIATVLPVDRTVASLAADLQAAGRVDVPLAEAVVAASASVARAILVHCDPRYAALTKAPGAPQQLVLPDRI